MPRSSKNQTSSIPCQGAGEEFPTLETPIHDRQVR
jgi:hypothetical protein